ncbi:MAG: hypothetical protein ABIP71_13670 [Verrucomicrobiota bacterium]
MNCPHCQKELPENYSAAYCPVCGKGLPPQVSPTLTSETPSTTKQKISWPLFFIVWLAPVLLTSLTVLAFSNKNEGAVYVGLFGGGISGIICGVMLGRRLGKTRELRIVLGVVFALIMVVVCVAMNSFGCLVSGYNLNFH